MFLALLLSACGETALPTPTAELPTPQSSVISTPPEQLTEPTPAPTEQASKDTYTQYHFDVVFDYIKMSLQVSQQINYLNKSAKALNEVLLMIPPKAFPAVYNQIELEGEQIASFSEDGIRTTINLRQALMPGENLQIKISYTLNLPQREGTFGFTQRQTNLSNWYPFIPPLDNDNDWISHDPFVDANNMVVGEYIVNEIADFSVTLELIGNVSNLKIASGAVPIPLEVGTRYELKNARAIAFSISDQFFLEELQHNGVLIQAYVFSNQKQNAKAMTEIAAQSLDLFSELFGTYQRDHIALVSADFLHNMEMDGMVLLSHKIIDFYDDTPLNNLTILIPHELSHQWFYSLVGNNQALEPWLDEAIATYSESLYYERYHPEYLQWWWDNRIYAHEHSGYVNNSIYQSGSYASYRGSVYLNGAIYLQQLSDLLGKETFLNDIKAYVQENQFKITSSDEFFNSFPSVDAEALQALNKRFFR